MTTDMKIKICHDDFYLMMRNAVIQSGGMDDVEKWKKMRLEEVVNMLAQNGIRMVYMQDRHIDALQVSWGKTTPKVKFDLPPGVPFNEAKPPRQLLTDRKIGAGQKFDVDPVTGEAVP